MSSEEVGGSSVGQDGERLEDPDSEEDLLQRHRKEKKELQATITNMRHSVSKSDRAKKKEITAEIARLEATLATKQAAELAEWKQRKSKPDENDALVKEKDENQQGEALAVADEQEVVNELTAASGPNIKAKKVTKAQKRREKKETKAKESEKVIGESEREVKQGVRYKEHQLFKTVLATKGLSFHHVQADGDCLYNALAHQLSLHGLTAQAPDLRQHAASVMKSNRDDYLPFLTNNNGDMLSEEEFEEYCAKLLKPGVWGGHPELVALSTYYKRPIEILQADATPILIGEQYMDREKPLVITYHRHAFRLGEHYNSTAPAKEGDTNEHHDDDI